MITEDIFVEEDDPEGDQRILKNAAVTQLSVVKPKWEWDFFGDNKIVFALPNVSWWQRMTTRFFFNSKWRRTL